MFDLRVRYFDVEVIDVGIQGVSVKEIREVLRGWLDAVELRVVAERASVDRKTARRYVMAV